MVDMFEILIPDFFSDLHFELEENIDVCWRNNGVSVSSLSWWFEYLKIFTDLDNRLKFSDICRIETTIYVDSEPKYSSFEYLQLIGHNVKAIRNLSERDVSSLKEDVIILTIRSENTNMVFELQLPESEGEKVVKYRKFVVEEANWLRREIAFLNNRMRGFNHQTPKPLRQEVQDKLDRYREDLRCYEINYGV